jgi:ketosteroid isomerase-like protein
MSIAANKEVVCRYIDAYQDLTGATSEPLLHDEATIQLMVRASGLPLPTHYTKAEYLALFPQMATVLPNGIKHELRSLIGEGDWVAAETECFGPLPGGRNYNNVFHFLFGFRDGKIATVREYCDYLHTKEALFDVTSDATSSPT